MIDPREIEEIEALMPWYANGTLNPADRERVRKAISESPQLARSLALAEAERASVIAGNETLDGPPARVLAKLMSEINNSKKQRSFLAKQGLLKTWAGWLDKLSPTTLSWATATAVVLILAQSAFIGSYILSDPVPTFGTAPVPEGIASEKAVVPIQPSAPRKMVSKKAAIPTIGTASAPRESSSEDVAQLLIRLHPSATAASITSLLADNGARIVDGPLGGGIYRLRLDVDRTNTVAINRVLDNLRREDKIISFVSPDGG